jgi:tetratricopeptide (TPR) repeat protein
MIAKQRRIYYAKDSMIRSLRCILALVTVFAVLVPMALPAAGGLPDAPPSEVQYGDLSFDPSSSKWTLAENGETLLFLPSARSLANQGKLRVGPTRPAPGDVRAAREQIWARLSAGQEVQGTFDVNEAAPISFGGNHPNANAYYHRAHFKSGACAGVMVVEANRKITPFEMTLDTKNACYVLMDTFDFIKETLKVKPGRAVTPPPTSYGDYNLGTPSDQGPDPYDGIDWDGPDDWAYAVYDIHPVNVKRELRALALLNQNFIGSVQPKALTFDQVIATLRTMADDPKTKADSEKFKQMASKDPFMLEGEAFAGVLSGEPVVALLQIFSAYELNPNDANNWLNIAALLAHLGLANESMAVIKEMERTGKRPDPPVINANAAIEYLKGYNQLLLGQTLTAKGHLHQAMTLDPFLREAAVALALAQKLTGEEEAAEETYTMGVWRRRPSQTVYCGGTTRGSRDPDGPDIRPPITDMLDVSHGTPGVLPPFQHPHNWSEALQLKDIYLDRNFTAQWAREDQALGEQVVAISRRLSARPRTATEAWYQYLEFLMQTLEVDEPPVKKLAENLRRADKELDEAVKHIGQRTGPIYVQISLQPGDHHEELAALATQNVIALKPYAQAFDTAVRRLFRAERRFETGLVAQMGDREWNQRETLALQIEANSFWATLKGRLAGSYVLVASFVPPPQGQPNATRAKKDDIADCPENIRNLGLKYSFSLSDFEGPLAVGPDVKFGIKVGCDKVGFEAAYYPWKVKGGLVEFEAGGFGQVEVKPRTGDLTLFVGETAKVSVGTSRAGVGASEKAGVYVEANVKDGSVKAIGLQAKGETVTKFGQDLQLNSKAFEGKPGNLRVEFLPSVETPPRGPNLADTRRAPSP